jgi:hypothetical protein
MARTGDQSLGITNGLGDMATALRHALELENRGIIPYVIDEHGFFKSTRLYPRICIYTKDNHITVAGDTLLEVKGVKSMPELAYYLSNNYFVITGNDNNTVDIFDGGQPITGQSFQPLINNIDACGGAYITFEVYGPKFRKTLIDYRDKSKEGDYGVKLKMSSKGMNCQTFGCNNSGFLNENNLIRI